MRPPMDFDRKQLTFEQAEGIDPLPTQLKPGEITNDIRVRVARSIVGFLEESSHYGALTDDAKTIMRDLYVERLGLFASEAPVGLEDARDFVEEHLGNGPWYQVYGVVQWLIRHKRCPQALKVDLSRQLRLARAPYRVIDGDTLFPISDEENARTVVHAVKALKEVAAHGAISHIKRAGAAASTGDWSGSVRESIHAVESVIKVLNPGASTLGETLAILRKEGGAHPALCLAFEKLYGFTSDEKGVRHAYLNDPTNSVDEPLALFMLSACSAFCSYLVSKHRS